jgi:hypothetical protein
VNKSFGQVTAVSFRFGFSPGASRACRPLLFLAERGEAVESA